MSPQILVFNPYSCALSNIPFNLSFCSSVNVFLVVDGYKSSPNKLCNEPLATRDNLDHFSKNSVLVLSAVKFCNGPSKKKYLISSSITFQLVNYLLLLKSKVRDKIYLL